jgi:hypothetical protein
VVLVAASGDVLPLVIIIVDSTADATSTLSSTAGATSTTASRTGAISTTGLMTASGGLTVPSGQTLTSNGTLSLSTASTDTGFTGTLFGKNGYGEGGASITIDQTTINSNYIYFVNGGSGITITLPISPTTNQIITIRNIFTNPVTIKVGNISTQSLWPNDSATIGTTTIINYGYSQKFIWRGLWYGIP